MSSATTQLTNATEQGDNVQVNKLDGEANLKTRKLGIHGARAAGKTSFLACLYGCSRSVESSVITFEDDASLDYLKEAWRWLEKGNNPMQATGAGIPTDIKFSIACEGVAWSAQTRDYAGALVQRTKTGIPELQEDVRNWLKHCNAVLIFIDLSTPTGGDAHRDRHDELDLLVTELRQQSRDGNSINCPLALVVTKWDLQGEISENWESEKQRLVEYVSSQSALRQIAEMLGNWGDRVDVFPVSAFGGNREGAKPPATGPKPYGLHEPIVWALQKSDEMLFEQAQRKAEACEDKEDYEAAIRCYKELDEEYAINKGCVHDRMSSSIHVLTKKLVDSIDEQLSFWKLGKEITRLEQLVDEIKPNAKAHDILWQTRSDLRREWTIRASKLSVAALSIAFFACALLAYLWDTREFKDTVALLEDQSATPEEVTTRCDAYLKTWNPLSRMLRRDDELRQRLDEYAEDRSKQDFVNLNQYRDGHLEHEFANSRLAECEAFLNKWSGCDDAPTVEGWKAEDAALAKEHEKYVTCVESFYTLQQTLSELDKDDYKTQLANCDAFLKQFADADYPRNDQQIEDVKAKREAIALAKSEQDWADVVAYEQQNPNNFDRIVKLATDYKNRPDARYREKAGSLIARTEVRWDRDKYEKVRNATKAATDSKGIASAAKIAASYIDSTHPLKNGLGEVRKWMSWFNGLAGSKGYYFEIKSVAIPDGSVLADYVLTTELIQVHLKLNGKRLSSNKRQDGQNPQFNQKLGRFNYKWGDKTSLFVEVEEYDSTGNDTANGAGDLFAVARNSDPFLITDSNGKKVKVYLQCLALIPPALKPYPEK